MRIDCSGFPLVGTPARVRAGGRGDVRPSDWLRSARRMLGGWLLHAQELFRRPLLVVGSLTLFGGAIRLYHLGFKPLWFDEAVLYRISSADALADLVTWNAADNSAPPLYAFLIHLVLKIGDSEEVLRSVSWAAGVAAIPATYFLARQFLDRAPAYFVAALVTVAPQLVRFSQQLREYSLAFLAASLLLALFCRYVRRPTWRASFLFTAVCVLGIFLQYGLALLVLSLNLAFVADLLLRKGSRVSELPRWAAGQALAFGAAAAVYAVALREQIVVTKDSYLAGGFWGGSLTSLARLAIVNSLALAEFAYPASLFLFLVIVGLISAALSGRMGARALGLTVLPILVTFCAALARLYPYGGIRHDMFLLPMLFVAAGFGWRHLSQQDRSRWVVWTLTALVLLAGLRSARIYLNDPGLENIRPVVRALDAGFRPGDRIYVYYGAEPAFRYYYRKRLDAQTFGSEEQADGVGMGGPIDRVLSGRGRVWLVFTHCRGNECVRIPKDVATRRRVDLVAGEDDTWLYLVQ